MTTEVVSRVVAFVAIACVFAQPGRALAQFTAVTQPPLGSRGSAFGVSWGDFDDDGDPDLYVTHDGPNLLLRNDGDRFVGATAPPLDDAGNGGAAVWGDADNDGDLDLYLVNFLTANRLFRNDGVAGFTDVTTTPIDDAGPGLGAAWADYDRDGDLDLYVVNYGTPNKLFRNEGDCLFTDATIGPLGDAGWGLAAAWGDYDNDGDPDLYVTNDGLNRLLRNDGAGAFVNVASGWIADSGAGQGAAWGDFDDDGDLDLYLANYGTTSKLFRNDGADVFTPLTQAPLGFVGSCTGVAWADFDNDGDLDVYVSAYGSGNRLLRNDGGGAFSALTAGPLGDDGADTGVAWADHDRDGDVDLYVAADGTGCMLLRNDLATGAGWLHLDLRGTISNRSGIGARVEIVANGRRSIREVSGGSGYMSQDSPTVEFGLGSATVVDSLVVRWPSGIVQRQLAVAANQRLTITEPGEVDVDAATLPAILELSPPRPNPSSGETLLGFALPSAAQVKLTLHDLQGRVVAAWATRRWPAGRHQVRWSGRGPSGERTAAGVYWLRLEAEGRIRTRKLVRIS